MNLHSVHLKLNVPLIWEGRVEDTGTASHGSLVGEELISKHPYASGHGTVQKLFQHLLEELRKPTEI